MDPSMKKNISYSTIDGTLIKKIVSEAVDILGFEDKKILHLNITNLFEDNFSLFDTNKNKKLKNQYVNKETSEFNKEENQKYSKDIDAIGQIIEGNSKNKYDFIFADIPFDGRSEKDYCLSIMKSLESSGVGVFLMPSYLNTFKSFQGKKFTKNLKEEGYKVLSVIQLPRNLMRPSSMIQTNLIFLTEDNGIAETYFAKCSEYQFFDFQSKLIGLGMLALYDKKTRKEFFEAETDEIKKTNRKRKNLFYGVEENIDNFNGFEHWENEREFQKIETEYGGYNFLKLNEFTTINQTRDKFDDLDNAFYIPAIGETLVTKEIPDESLKKKPQNYFQIIVNNNRVKKEYLVIYFNSEHGQKSIELEFLKYAEVTMQMLRKTDIENILIPVPNLGIQDEIIENISKLKKVKTLLTSIENSLSFKPISSSEQLSKLNQIYESSMDLSEVEITFNDIKKGESINREFKQTFALDIKSKKREDHIVFECIKTVAGFLNGSGGNLYIGVADNSDITGINVEIGSKKLFKSLDKYLLSIKDTLKRKLGVASLKNCNFVPVKLKGKQILTIKCQQSGHQVYIDEKDTYLRVGPSTEKLEGPELVKFSKERFG